MGRSKRYRYAAEHLGQCERLEARIDDWQGFESHASFVGRLRQAFAQKWSFWQLLERRARGEGTSPLVFQVDCGYADFE